MGGLGSGERWRKKRTVEGCRCLDTTTFRRWGWFGSPGSRSGTLGWGAVKDGRHEAEIGYDLFVGEGSGSVRLRYALPADPSAAIDYSVRLLTTPCHLGGRRWWFGCPLSRDGVACGRRVRKLYLVGRYFGCRRCHGLTYTSTQQSDARVYSLARAGLDVIGDLRGHSVAELGVTLRALTILKTRFDRPSRLR